MAGSTTEWSGVDVGNKFVFDKLAPSPIADVRGYRLFDDVSDTIAISTAVVTCRDAWFAEMASEENRENVTL